MVKVCYNKRKMNKRLKFLKIVLYVVAGVIVARLFQIQILQKEQWVAKAEAQHTFENTIKAKRGEVYMMDGSEAEPVVMNEQVYTVVVDPFEADEEEIERVIFDEKMKDYLTAEIGDVFKDKTRRYYVVAKNVPRELAQKIRDEEPGAVWLQERTKRVYPEGTLAARLLGFVNEDGEGQYDVYRTLTSKITKLDS